MYIYIQTGVCIYVYTGEDAKRKAGDTGPIGLAQRERERERERERWRGQKGR
jgi:hypothetical protein